MEQLLIGLRAAGEQTRLRLLALCAHAELAVSELTQILGQSQPRVSRHLKLLCDAGLLERYPEGTWAFYRLAERGARGDLGRTLIDLIPPEDPILARDLARLEAVKRARAEAAAAYFRANAEKWDEIRALYVPEADVEARLLGLLSGDRIHDFLDIGTGTGRILEVFGPKIERGMGIDLSHEMLAVARSNLERRGLRHCQVRHGDMYALPLPNETFDAVTFHQVLHFSDEPAAAISEAARVLRKNGRLLVIDFRPHDLEFLRSEHAHRRLGFTDEEVAGWFRGAALDAGEPVYLEGDPLTVVIWSAQRKAA